MENKSKIKELGNKLPRGAKIKISHKCGVSRSLVTQFFNGNKTPSLGTIKKILVATCEVVEDYKKESKAIDLIVDTINL
ncbi:helix-turn-helix domain-containing protein [Marinifilum caeruleilacunae]|uniref:XRE family transcriptional regulator n=1 Tax=Marinifilum caeruleilacunae TaxID=2499076 RepID=A0ABX1WXE2_9BACT|nr:helix-turn-helix transcriptional regulator [Marinifilum caeruleilacunae]NOU60813.1 XRE family transcriptional regulator [Marinifilum caeruleilacunae]